MILKRILLTLALTAGMFAAGNAHAGDISFNVGKMYQPRSPTQRTKQSILTGEHQAKNLSFPVPHSEGRREWSSSQRAPDDVRWDQCSVTI